MTVSGGSEPSYEERPFGFPSRLDIIALIVWEVLLVFVFMLFSPPMGGANKAVGLPMSLMNNFPALISLFYHSFALPLAGLLVLVALSVFDVGERSRYAIGHAITAGCLLSSGAMAFVFMTGASLLAYAVMVFGMGLGASAAVALLLSLWPHRAPLASMKLLGFDLTKLAMWVVVAAAIASVAAGSYAALGNSQWSYPSLLGRLPSLEAVHEGLIIAFINAAAVVLVVKWFRADRYLGAPGLLVKVGLYGVLIGTPAVALFAFAAMSTITTITGAITILSSVPMQASVFVMCAVMAEEVRRLHVRGPLGAIKESLVFGLLFLFYWADIVVVLPAIYSIVHSTSFTNQYVTTYHLNILQTGNEHALVTLTALLLFMLVAVMFGVRGKIGALAGLSLISGYVLSTTADVFYMFNLTPNGTKYIPYIGDGITLMMLGVLVALVGILASSRRQEYMNITIRLVRSSRATRAGAVTLALCLCIVPILATVNLPPPTFENTEPVTNPLPYTQLTTGNWDDRSPVWAPNGSLIAYVSTEGSVRSVWVMRANGSAAKQVSTTGLVAEHPEWSPDSSSISYRFTKGAVSGYEVVDLTTLQVRRITTSAMAAFNGPAMWSPDGSLLAFFSGGLSPQLIVYDTRTGSSNPVTDVSGLMLAASWVSNDELVYSSYYNGSNCLTWAKLSTGESGLLVGGPHNFIDPSVGPNGILAYYSDFNPVEDSPLLQGNDGYSVCFPGVDGSLGDCVFFSINETRYVVWLSGVDGSNATFQSEPAWLANGNIPISVVPYSPGTMELATPPAWSPDGTKVAYVTSSSLLSRVFVWSTTDGSFNPLGPLQVGFFSFEPTWSPDGLNVAFACNATGTYHIWVENMTSVG